VKPHPGTDVNDFSIRNLLDSKQIDRYKTYKKNFFVLSDKLDIKEDVNSISVKREMIKSKLFSDKSIMNERTDLGGLFDNIINKIYIGFSNDSRKFLDFKSEGIDDQLRNYFFHLIGFNPEVFKSKQILSNQMIMDLCSNIITIDHCKYLF